ncbi:MAG: hypothetical protein RJA70_3332 [Pseudomonadota bacterium]|jgi:hypothetical protein
MKRLPDHGNRATWTLNGNLEARRMTSGRHHFPTLRLPQLFSQTKKIRVGSIRRAPPCRG